MKNLVNVDLLKDSVAEGIIKKANHAGIAVVFKRSPCIIPGQLEGIVPQRGWEFTTKLIFDGYLVASFTRQCIPRDFALAIKDIGPAIDKWFEENVVISY